MAAGAKIIEGLKDAVAGNFSRVTIDGQTWARIGVPEEAPARCFGWRAVGGGLILIRREFELAPGCCCGPIIDRSAELNLAVHDPVIHDVDKPAPATLFLEALADWRHPFPVE